MAELTPAQQNQQQKAQQAQQPVDEFELMRRRLQRRGAAAGEERQRELSRQFAALGNLPSGAAFRIRQQAAEAGERATSEALQDVNILQAQTRRGEREAEAQRGLQRELAGQQIAAQRDIAAQEVGARRDISAAELASREELQRREAQSALEQISLSGENARALADMEQATQLKVARIDEALRKQGNTIQKALADAQIESGKVENVLNTTVSFINALGPLREAGFSRQDVTDMFANLELGNIFPAETIMANFFDQDTVRAGAARTREIQERGGGITFQEQAEQAAAQAGITGEG